MDRAKYKKKLEAFVEIDMEDDNDDDEHDYPDESEEDEAEAFQESINQLCEKWDTEMQALIKEANHLLSEQIERIPTIVAKEVAKCLVTDSKFAEKDCKICGYKYCEHQ